ncbi:MAG: WbqC family protein [Candidatus Atribacteria bacterium]|nr:WbqC family protein [Candidatus Atribacteria bacterium]
MLKNQDRIIEICKTSGRTNYINQIGEAELYDKEGFLKKGIKLKFIETESFEYD